MSTKEPAYIYLRDIFKSGNDDTELQFVDGKQEQVRTIKKALGFNNTNRTDDDKIDLSNDSPQLLQDLAHVTLDIKNVIITPRFENTLYSWMSNFNLNVVDTSTDPNVYQLKTDEKTGEIVEVETPITERHEVLMEFKRQLLRRQRAYDITNFYVMTESGKKGFTRDSAKAIVELIAQRQKDGETRKLPLSIKNVSVNDSASVLEISAFLISAVNHTEIDDHSSEIGRFHILPTIAQLCADFSYGADSWLDIKRKYPEGTELYFSRKASIYTKGRVVENKLTNDEGEDLTTKKSLTELEKERLFSMKVEYENPYKELKEGITTEDDTEDSERIFYLRRNYIIGLEVLVYPVAIFEGGKSVGLPDSKELAGYKENNVIKPRAELELNQRESLLFDEEGDGGLHEDYVAKYRRLTHRMYRELGGSEKIPEVDLQKIIRGEDSPFMGKFIANTESYRKM